MPRSDTAEPETLFERIARVREASYALGFVAGYQAAVKAAMDGDTSESAEQLSGHMMTLRRFQERDT